MNVGFDASSPSALRSIFMLKVRLLSSTNRSCQSFSISSSFSISLPGFSTKTLSVSKTFGVTGIDAPPRVRVFSDKSSLKASNS